MEIGCRHTGRIQFPARLLSVAFFWLVLAVQSRAASEPSSSREFWDGTITVRPSFGYNDNVTLSRRSPQESPFLSLGLDYFLWHPPMNGNDFSWFFSADDTRYLNHDPTDKEQLVMSQLVLKHYVNSKWMVGGSLTYLYQDQVFDGSDTETNLTSVRALGHFVGFRPTVRHYLATNSWVDVQLYVSRQNFFAPLDDHTEVGPNLSLTTRFGHESVVRFSYWFYERRFDDHLALEADATAIPGRAEVFDLHHLELEWEQNWDQAKHWRSSTRVFLESNSDNGGGYFDFKRYHVDHGLRVRPGKWEIRLQFKYDVYDYSVQTVSDTDLRKRAKSILGAGARVERKIFSGAKVFANYEHERSISNTVLDAYRGNIIKAGMEYEF